MQAKVKDEEVRVETSDEKTFASLIIIIIIIINIRKLIIINTRKSCLSVCIIVPRPCQLLFVSG